MFKCHNLQGYGFLGYDGLHSGRYIPDGLVSYPRGSTMRTCLTIGYALLISL